MKITAQEEYGLRCLLRLARAPGDEPLTIPEVAAAEQLSVPYVAKLLSVLRQAGLIESVRGRAGGYRLAKAPAEVRLGAVMRALGEPLFEETAYCERHASPEAGGVCVHQGGCSLRALWQTLEGWVRRVLDQVTLADLLQSEGQAVATLRANLPADETEVLSPLLPLTTLRR
ncbi:MAG TPA: Rrf2 family transcriptional regulator [Gemmataceae bacterium]|jgi:Rrf2 family protein|nr:Rrf2 family transcriptional regulator [Gemmataceae bacterium]